jgi:transglutaminase superfamily protein
MSVVFARYRALVLCLGAGALAVSASADLLDYWVERRMITSEAADRAKSKHEIAEAITEKVRSRVTPSDHAASFLRSTALETWVTGKGDCGDAARVMVLMLRHARVDASRIYLRADASDYFHVAVTYRVGQRRYLADTVNSTTDFQRFIAMNRRRALDEIALPNEQFYSYSYVNWARVLPFLHVDRRTPPPRLAVLFSESPALVLASTKLGVVSGVVLSALVSRRRLRFSGR